MSSCVQNNNHHDLIWLRDRAIGTKRNTNSCVTIDSVSRLKLENVLKGHTGCVNCLDWNQEGNLLASGSDDTNVILWDPFKDSSDTLVATCAGDAQVKLIDTIQGEILMNCKSCHSDRVKRLVVHPNEPHLVWSAGEEGYILQHDIRQEHRCSSKPKNLLLDLRRGDIHLTAKCLAINPLRDEMLAVGANDAFIRLFDRRYMQQDGFNSCTAYFTPGHLVRPSLNKITHPLSSGTTYLSFSPDGTELLANLHAEQVYLFNVDKPWERYKSFEDTIKPLILDLETSSSYVRFRSAKPIKPFSLWRDLKKSSENTSKLPEEHNDFYKIVRQKVNAKSKLSKEEFDKLNQLLASYRSCVELYNLRSSALINRGWKGDHYQAIRDCCCAFALNPLEYSSLQNIAIASHHTGDKEARTGLLEIMKMVQQDYDQLSQSKKIELLDGDVTPPLSFLLELQQQSGMDTEFMDENDSYYPNQFESTRLFSNCNSIPENLSVLQQEQQRALTSFDYSKRFCGHCNMNTEIKEANFFGNFIVGGSDDGAFYIWDKQTTNVIKAIHADLQILNCLQPHPSICMLATSGIESDVKIWSPTGKTCHDVQSLDLRCTQNQEYITSDPLEAMIMMLYPNSHI